MIVLFLNMKKNPVVKNYIQEMNQKDVPFIIINVLQHINLVPIIRKILKKIYANLLLLHIDLIKNVFLKMVNVLKEKEIVLILN